MDKKHPVGEMVELTMDKLREMIDVNTVVGTPIHTPEGVTVIPVSKVSMGLVSGGSDFSTKNQPATKENCLWRRQQRRGEYYAAGLFDYQGGQRQAAAGGDAAGRAYGQGAGYAAGAFDKSICDD